MNRKTLKELLEQPTKKDDYIAADIKENYKREGVWLATLTFESIRSISEKLNGKKMKGKEVSYIYNLYKKASMYELMYEININTLDERYEFPELFMKQFVNPLSNIYETLLKEDTQQ